MPPVSPRRDRRLVLLIDDSPLDLEFTRIAFEACGHPPADLLSFDESRRAWAYLHSEAATELRLIVLDLDMPGMNGLDLLRAVRADARLALTPVVVLSTSDEDEDVEASYRSGASAYLVKPLHYDAYRDMIAALCGFWVSLNRFVPPPSGERPFGSGLQ